MKEKALVSLLNMARFNKLDYTFISDINIKQIEKEFLWVRTLAETDIRIYGSNTLPGHRDDVIIKQFDSQELEYIINSHMIPTDNKPYNRFQARCITITKAISIRNGGTGVSPELFLHLIDAVNSPLFLPNIPKGQSYSSGDVIPGAYWANSLLDWNGYRTKNTLHPAEPLALINGSFVHLGAVVAQVPELLKFKTIMTYAFSAIASLSRATASNFQRQVFAEHADAIHDLEIFDYYVTKFSEGLLLNTGPQVSVSIRSFPDIVISVNDQISKLTREINYCLHLKSGNPLFDSENQTILSQASFMLPNLAIHESSIIEALLLTGSALLGGINYILSGRVREIPVDGYRTNDMLGLIQAPKELQARFEHIRLKFGRRVNASGSSTSYGIEDIWTFGAELTDMLEDCLKLLIAMFIRSICVCEILAHFFYNKEIFYKLEYDKNDSAINILRSIEGNYCELLCQSIEKTIFD